MNDEDLHGQLVPLIEELVTELAPRLVERIAPIVRELVRAQLRTVLETLGGEVEEPAKPSRAPRKPAVGPDKRAAIIAKRVKNPGVGRGGTPGACSKCGKAGHNARTCGKKADADDEEGADVHVDPPSAHVEPPVVQAAPAIVHRDVKPDNIVLVEPVPDRAPEQGGGNKPPLFGDLVRAGHAARGQQVAARAHAGDRPAARVLGPHVATRDEDAVTPAPAPVVTGPRRSLDELKAIRQLARRSGRRDSSAVRAVIPRPPRALAVDIGITAVRAAAAALTEADHALLAQRPRTRGECVNVARPCPWAGCRHNLLLDVFPETGSVKLNFEVLDLAPSSCALDVADQGEHTLEQVGFLLNVTRERIRQIERVATQNLYVGLARAGVRPAEALSAIADRHNRD